MFSRPPTRRTVLHQFKRLLALTLVAVLGVLSPATARAQSPEPEAAQPEVIGGQPADPGEDPWMAALVIDTRFEPNPYTGLICGASFIAPDALVTAAHCVEGFPDFLLDIVAGSTNLVPAEVERLEIRNIRIHPLRDWRSGMYDVAVIQLEQLPSFTVTPIDLVTPADAALWEPGDMARFTGWGVDEAHVPISQLLEAEAPIVADTECRARYTGTYFRGRTMVCAGEIGPGGGLTSPCYGDSGGPLTVKDGSRPVLVGLVLGGFRCGDPNYPAIFTQVSAVTGFLRPYLDPDSVPQRVRAVSATREGAQRRTVVVRWDEPVFDGGARITQYLVTLGNRQINVSGDADRLRLRNVAPGPAQVSVAARNGVGLGPAVTVPVPA